MKIENVKSGAFYIARAPYNWNSVVITDVGEWGCLKVLANSKKYFNGYYPEFTYVNGTKTSKITKSDLKYTFERALEWDRKYFTNNEIEELGKFFKIKIENFLTESKSCTRVKGYKKPTTNKRVKTYARKRAN